MRPNQWLDPVVRQLNHFIVITLYQKQPIGFLRSSNLMRYKILYNEVYLPFHLFHFYFFGHIHQFFGQVQWLMFVGVIFRSRSIVHVRRCEFHLVIF